MACYARPSYGFDSKERNFGSKLNHCTLQMRITNYRGCDSQLWHMVGKGHRQGCCTLETVIQPSVLGHPRT